MALDKPHDKFFKDTFSNLIVAADFARAFLPPLLATGIDFTTLRRENETYLDESLNEYYVDLLFTVDYGQTPVQLALLFEHKSYVEEYPHWQLNQYLLNYWNRQARTQNRLSPVLPILIYHGDRPGVSNRYRPTLNQYQANCWPTSRRLTTYSSICAMLPSVVWPTYKPTTPA